MFRKAATWLARRKFGQIVAGFALLGVLGAAGAYAYNASSDPAKPLNGVDDAITLASFVLCPPTLFLVECIDCEATGWDGFATFSIIGLLNAGLYAIVGIVVASSKEKRQGPPDEDAPD